jgi:hypothetical protein
MRMSMSLVGVFSSLTVEPNNPSWHTPTARRGAFSVERILMTVLFSIYFVFVVPDGRLLACGRFRCDWPAAKYGVACGQKSGKILIENLRK